MNADLIVVLVLLVASIAMFAVGRPRMDVVAVLLIVALPLSGVLSLPETLAGFADPNVILIAALFVVGEGLSRTGVTYRLGDWLARTAGAHLARTIVLLMLCVALLGAVMSSTGVVAIFIPVALSVAARTGVSPRQLLMPLSVAGLISGMLTLIATTPNLVIDAELTAAGHDGFSFFAPTPFGLVILALGIGYMLFAQRFLVTPGGEAGTDRRRTLSALLSDYGVGARVHGYRVAAGSALIGTTLGRLPARSASPLLLERGRLWRSSRQTAGPDAVVRQRDVLYLDRELSPEDRDGLGLDPAGARPDFFERFAAHLAATEVMIPPSSSARGHTVDELALRQRHGLVVLGVRHRSTSRSAQDAVEPLATGDTLLVTGRWDAVRRLQTERRDYLVLELPAELDDLAPAAARAPFALLSVAVMIVLMVTGVVPNTIAALIAALLMGVSGCIDMPSAYRSIHWPTLLLIVGMLPFALALQRTGGVDLAVDAFLGTFGGASPTVLLAAVFALTALVGLFISNTATAVLIAPIAIHIADELGASPLPFAMIVALAASSAFVTPISSPVNTLVVEPGRYRFGDFVRIGAPFALLVMVVSVVLVPILLPLY